MVEDLNLDSDEYDIEELVENVTDCPGCSEACGHEVLREKKAGTGTDYLLKCEECAHIVFSKNTKDPFVLKKTICFVGGFRCKLVAVGSSSTARTTVLQSVVPDRALFLVARPHPCSCFGSLPV